MNQKEMQMCEIQQESLKILDTVAALCDKLQLRYYLAYGTLIGAVRHQGFIPWDDDIDIMMPRKDYAILLDYFQTHAEELKPLELYSTYNCPDYPYMISRISNSDYVLDVHNEKPYGLGLFLDIYPMDGMGNSVEEYEALKNKATRLSSLCFLSTRLHCEKGNTKKKWKLLVKYPAFLFARLCGKNTFVNRLEKMAANCDYDASSYVGCLVWGSDGVKGVFPKEWFAETADVPFEGRTFKAPGNYDAVLTRLYGNYMQLPPEKDRIAHHFYKAYKK